MAFSGRTMSGLALLVAPLAIAAGSFGGMKVSSDSPRKFLSGSERQLEVERYDDEKWRLWEAAAGLGDTLVGGDGEGKLPGYGKSMRSLSMKLEKEDSYSTSHYKGDEMGEERLKEEEDRSRLEEEEEKKLMGGEEKKLKAGEEKKLKEGEEKKLKEGEEKKPKEGENKKKASEYRKGEEEKEKQEEKKDKQEEKKKKLEQAEEAAGRS